MVPTAILSGPIHILRKRDGERRGRGVESGSRPGWGRTGERQNMFLARQEAACGGRRTVPVAFGPCRVNASIRFLVSFDFHAAKMIFSQSAIVL